MQKTETVTNAAGFEITADVDWVFTGFGGIGSYEVHGYKGFDKGRPEWEPDTVELISVVDKEGNDVDLSTLSPTEKAAFESDVAELAEAPTDEPEAPEKEYDRD